MIQEVLPVEASMLNPVVNSLLFPMKSENNKPFHLSGHNVLPLQNSSSAKPIVELGMLAMSNSDQQGVEAICNDQIVICAAAEENNPEPNPKSSFFKKIVRGT